MFRRLKSPALFVEQLAQANNKEISNSAWQSFCKINPPMTNELPSQKDSDADSVSMHNVITVTHCIQNNIHSSKKIEHNSNLLNPTSV